MKKTLQIFAETLLVGLLVFILTVTNVFRFFDNMAKDSLYQIPRGIDSKIKIIGIDEKTMAELGPIQTWSRSFYANLLRKLNEKAESKPLLVGFDVLFSGNVDEGDDDFTAAAAEAGNVVIVDHLIYGRKLTTNEDGFASYPVESIEEPFESLSSVCNKGYSNVSQDSDGTVRRIIPSEVYEGAEQKMFSNILYEEYCKKKGITPNAVPVDKNGRAIINYSGKPGDYEYVSMIDVLNGNIDARAFTDSIVLVGAYAPGMQDDFEVPNGGSQQMYGVEVHANILQSYIQGRFSVNGNKYIFGLISAFIAMLMYLLFRKFKPWLSLIIMIIVIIAFVFVLIIFNNHGTAYSIIYLPMMLILSYIASLALGYLRE